MGHIYGFSPLLHTKASEVSSEVSLQLHSSIEIDVDVWESNNNSNRDSKAEGMI